MTYTCISSDVTTISLSLTIEEMRSFSDNNEQFLINDDQIEKRIDYSLLDKVDNAIEKKINDFWINHQNATQVNQPYTEIAYKEKIFRLKYSDQEHFTMGTLITLKKLIAITILKKGTLFFFNKTILKRLRTPDVLSFLKVKNAQQVAEIEQGINELAKQYRTLPMITKDEIYKSLEFLRLNGFVDNDLDDSSRFRLTGKGYILSL